MAEPKKPVASITPFGLRLQPELKEKLDEAARAADRSLNAEIVQRLSRSVEADEIARRNYPHNYKITIDLPKDTIDRIRIEADENRRDLNNEISYTLERQYPDIYPLNDIIDAVQDALNKAMVSHSKSEVGRLHDVLVNATHRMFVDYEENCAIDNKQDMRKAYTERIQEISRIVGVANNGKDTAKGSD